jgi:hypothetical protein
MTKLQPLGNRIHHTMKPQNVNDCTITDSKPIKKATITNNNGQ